MNYQESSISSVPTADISVNKNRVKKYQDNKIYLENGTEFEIELTNRTSFNHLAKIWVNGNPIGNTGLVIRAGQHYFLDRFIDEQRKFLFDTYTVDDSSEARRAIKNNGNVTVKFYKENVSHQYVPWTVLYEHSYNPYYTTPTWTSVTTRGGVVSSTASYSSYYYNASAEIVNDSNGLVETGRVEKGSASDQEFTSVNMTFGSLAVATYDFKILPISSKHNLVDNIRVYCTECGRRQRKGDRFCPGCGTRF